MGSRRVVRITKMSLSRIMNKGVRPVCPVCGKPLKVGDEAVRNGNFSRWYHKRCYDKLWLDV
ncbi:hypothetical protein J7K27_02090 [Candidatus Bathyarchaeota archaeon]|nr:hypothetical protein [Candidatus Bathyarchaeota archaeon]